MKGLMEVPQKYPRRPPEELLFRKLTQLIDRKRFPKGLIGAFQSILDATGQHGAQRQPLKNTSGNGILGQFSENEIIAVTAVDAVAVAEKIAVGLLPPGQMGTPSKGLRMMLGKKKFVVAFYEAYPALALLSLAPGEEGTMQIVFIARQGDPQLENVTQKNHIPGALLQNGQHFEKRCGISFAVADMGIRDNHQRAARIGRRTHGKLSFGSLQQPV
jgi:hypothetical protein